MDPELRDAFLEEWNAACARLAAAPGDSRALSTLCGLCEAEGAESLRAHVGIAEPAALAAMAEALLRPATPSAAGVLIVDDSPTMRRILREIISQDGAFAVLGEAADGEAGLAAMARLQPALTLLDIEMPILDGLGVLRRWALRGPGLVLVVSSSAQAGGAVALDALRLGASGVVAKPSGALSLDMADRRGQALLLAARGVLGLPHAA